jgi:hypothetical protein
MTTGIARRSVERMKPLTTAAAVVAMLALATGPAGAHGAATTIKLVQHDSHFQFVDVAPKGGIRKPPTEGDQYVIGGTLSGGGKGAVSNLVCTVTQPGAKGMSECVGTLILAKGTITFGGVSRLATNGDTFSVIGGTGAYVGAHGLLVGSQGKGNDTNLAVKLG